MIDLLDLLARDTLKNAPATKGASKDPNVQIAAQLNPLAEVLSALTGTPTREPVPVVSRRGNRYLDAFRRVADDTGLSRRLGRTRAVNLLRAISLHENPRQDPTTRARNRNGTEDHGLMQVNDVNLRDFQGDVYDPMTNIRLGARIFATFLRGTDGDVEEALSRYNAGYRNRAPDGTRRNQTYVDAVMRNLQRLER